MLSRLRGAHRRRTLFSMMSSALDEPAGVFAIVLAAALAVPFLAERLKIPKAAGIVLAGVFLGPSLSGLLRPSAGLEFFTSLGLCYVFFIAGAEMDLSKFARHPSRNALFAALTFIVPFLAGFAVGLSLPGASIPRALLTGAFLASAGTGACHSLEKLGMSRLPSSAAALGGTTLAQTASVTILAVLVWLSPGSFGAPAALAASGAVAGVSLFGIAASILFVVVVFFALPGIASLFLRKSKADGATEAVFLLFLAYASAWIAAAVGLRPFIGAYLAGISLGKFLRESSPIAVRLRFVGTSFMVPVFLISFGASIDVLPFFRDPDALIAGAAIIATALAAKWLAAEIGRSTLNEGKSERAVFFGLSSSYDSLSIAFVAVAVAAGVFPKSYAPGVVLLSAASCVLTQVTVRRSAGRPAPTGESGMNHGTVSAGRILVAISKPSTASSLMELAFLLREGESLEPVFPLAVVSESEEGRDGFARAEDMLASALVQSVSSSIPVVPVTRMSMNVSKGILQAAAEQKADSIVIGWNKPPRLVNAFFGSVIEQVVTGGGRMVFVARLPSPLSAARQLVIVAPPTCETHPGFAAALASLHTLARNLQARTLLATLKPHGKALSAAFSEVGGAGFSGMQTIELDEWRYLDSTLGKNGGASRMYILLSARPGEKSWHPAVERLPHFLGEDSPDSGLIMMYFPSPDKAETHDWQANEQADEHEDTVSETEKHGDLLREALLAGRILTDMRQTAVADGIRDLLAAAFPGNRKAIAGYSATFTEIAQRKPIELEPGVVLLHARVAEIEKPVVCFGAHRQGFRLSALEEPARVLVLICVPEDQSPELHLAVLGDIARLLKDGAFARRILAADSPDKLL